MFVDDMKPCEVITKVLRDDEPTISFKDFKDAVTKVNVRAVPSRLNGKFDVGVEVVNKKFGEFYDCFMMDGIDGLPPERDRIVIEGFKRFVEKVMRGGQMNINGVFISGYERIVLLKRKLKKYAWQSDHVQILLCKDSFSERYLMEWNVQLPNSTMNRLHSFLLCDVPNEIETRREAIERALDEMEAELPRIEQMVESQARPCNVQKTAQGFERGAYKTELGRDIIKVSGAPEEIQNLGAKEMTTKKIREQKLAEVAVEDVVTEDVEQFDTSEALANLLEQSEQEFINTLDALREPIDPKLIKSREGWRDREGNKHYVDYVEWHTVADILDRVCPFWTHEVKELKAFSEIMTCTVKLTINGVTREGVGSGDANNEKGIKKAEHDALKRAAVKFGVARDLYRKEASLEELEGAAPEYGSRYNQDVPADPVAKTISDLVTARQLGMIKAVCREMGIDPFEECEAAMHCSLDELSKRGASSFITYLQTPGARTPQEAVQAQGQAQGARPAPTRTFSARGNTPNGAPTITAVPKPTGLAVANKPSVNKLKIWIHDLGLTESEIALQYSGERTNDVSFLTQEECDRARANLSKM